MKDRRTTYLKENQILLLSGQPDGAGGKLYRIQSYVGEGGSAVCYEAVRESDHKTGKLKEFYPIIADQSGRWDFSMERLPDGRLIAEGEALGRFDEIRNDYLEAFLLLNRTIAEDSENQVLKNYIQDSEILYAGADDTETRGTAYIWTAGKAGTGFDAYLKEVRLHPEKNPERRLYEILEMTAALTDCIKALHTAGLMHLDIKPSNFMVLYDSDGNVRPSGISLFDINTLYPVGSNLPLPGGTYGFSAPELKGTGDESIKHFSGRKRRRRFSILTGGRPDNRADLYSIGAMLFYAIVITDEIPDGFYRGEYYDRIGELVRSSRLITGTEAGGDEKLLEQIVQILKGCLSRFPGNRYQSCSELLPDLTRAALYAGQYAVGAETIGQNKKIMIVDENEQGDSTPVIAMQKLLFDHPLYESLRGHPMKKGLHVLTIGSGVYAQKFIDVCLEAGQMDGISLEITALGTTPEQDRKNYLESRPEMDRFVDINGSMEQSPYVPYAELTFDAYPPVYGADCGECVSGFGRGEGSEVWGNNRRLVREILTSEGRKSLQLAEMKSVGQPVRPSEFDDSTDDDGFIFPANGADGKEKNPEPELPCDYVFIALGNDAQNRSVAGLFAEEIRRRTAGRIPVCFVSERCRETEEKTPEDGLCPVYIGEKITPQTIHPQLEQMAFNTHFCWDSSMNKDLRGQLQAFREDAYDYSSSLASAVSIPYKLFSVGIDEKDSLTAAGRFMSEILEKKDSDAAANRKYHRLVAMEHRRWVINMAAQGCRSPRNADGTLDLTECARIGKANLGKGKDGIRRHACLVHGTVSAPLSDSAYQKDHHAKWNDPDIDPALDDLDRMSVELHQKIRAGADRYRSENPLQDGDLEVVTKRISGCSEETGRAFRRFRFCLKNILNGAESYSRQYASYEQALFGALQRENAGIRDEITERLALIRKKFVPVIEANLYTDYKAKDEVLIDRIPFILTFQIRDAVALVFEDGRRTGQSSDAVFANVASATLLSPERLLYLYFYDRDSDPGFLIKKLRAVMNYLGKRRVHSDVSFAAAMAGSIAGEKKAELAAALQQLQNELDAASFGEASRARFVKYTIFTCENRDDAAAQLARCAKEQGADLFDGSSLLFDSALDNAGFLQQISETGIPYFELNRAEKRFKQTEGCEFLQYVSGDDGIRIQDMFALMNAESLYVRLPDYAEEYETIWGIYEENPECWNHLCRMLQKYEEKRRPALRLPLSAVGAVTEKQYEYRLPGFLLEPAEKALSILSENELSVGETEAEVLPGGDCMVRFAADESMQAAYDAFFAPQNLLQGLYGIEALPCRDYDGDFLNISFHNLLVEGLCIRPGIGTVSSVGSPDKKNVERGDGCGTQPGGGDGCVPEPEGGDGCRTKPESGDRCSTKPESGDRCGIEPESGTSVKRCSDQKETEIFILLNRLQETHFITGLRRDPGQPGMISFSYASDNMKKLLTSTGEILKLHTYYQVLETGYFDEVVCEYGFRWEEGGVKDELDLVLTKGFRSMIITCTDSPELEAESYHKLDSIAGHFGVGTRKVLIGNTWRQRDEKRQQQNAREKSRGSQMGILTVSDPDSIKNIGAVLVRIMDKS